MMILEAVNIMLTAAGQFPASQLDSGGTSYLSAAETILKQKSREVQLEGWAFNTVPIQTLTRDSSNRIAIPAGVLEIATAGVSIATDAAQLGAWLQNRTDNTNTFDADQDVTVTYLYEFPCVPEHVAQLIAYRAAQTFNDSYGHAAKSGMIYANVVRAAGEAKMGDQRIERVNVLDTAEARRVKGRRYKWSGQDSVPRF